MLLNSVEHGLPPGRNVVIRMGILVIEKKPVPLITDVS
jgi:hypothetical protein